MKTLLLAIAGALILIAGGLHFARGQGHAENHDWYKDLKQPVSGGSCCNALTADGEGDCRPATVWRDEAGIVRWGRQIVPHSAVLPDYKNHQPLTGHICERNGRIYCALVGGAGG